MAVTFLTVPQAISLSTVSTTTWTTVATGAGPGATGVMLLWVNGGTSNWFSARKTGSTDTVTGANVGTTTNYQRSVFVGCDGSGNVDVWVQTKTGLSLYLVGYFGSESTWFTNATAMASMSLSWSTPTNYNLATACPGAVAVFIELYGAQSGAGFRQNGSIDTWATGACNASIIVGVDGSQICQGAATGGATTPYLRGYMTSGITWELNAVQVSTGAYTTGQFQPVAQAAGETGNIIGYYYTLSGGSNFSLVGPVGTSFNPQVAAYGPTGLAVPGTSSNRPQINPALATVAVYNRGYFLGASVAAGTSELQLLGVGS